MRVTVQVGLALRRPPTVQRISQVVIESCCVRHAELDAISMASQIHRAEMPVSSLVVDWEE